MESSKIIILFANNGKRDFHLEKDEKEYHYIGNDVFLELSMTDFSDENLSAFASIRKYNDEVRKFELPSKEDYSLELVQELADAYAKKHNATYYK